MEYLIRRVKTGDESYLAYIQTESWKAAFKNILFPAYLPSFCSWWDCEKVSRLICHPNSASSRNHNNMITM